MDPKLRCDTWTAPIRFAALVEGGCSVTGRTHLRPIDWQFNRRRALYTNYETEEVLVSPFDVWLEPGWTVGFLDTRGHVLHRRRRTASCTDPCASETTVIAWISCATMLIALTGHGGLRVESRG